MKIQVVEIRFSIGWPGKVSISNNWEDFEGVSQVGKEHSRPEQIYFTNL